MTIFHTTMTIPQNTYIYSSGYCLLRVYWNLMKGLTGTHKYNITHTKEVKLMPFNLQALEWMEKWWMMEVISRMT